MIRKLQKKFIFIAMGSFLCVTVALVSLINITNFLRNDQRTDDLLSMISAVSAPPEEFRPEEEKPPRKENPGREDPWFSDQRGEFHSISITPETEFKTRWFSVTFDGNGAYLSSSVDRIAAVTREEAEQMGRKVLASGRSEGYEGIYKYRLTSKNDTETVWFLDCEEELQSNVFLLIATVCIGLICLLVLLFVITLLSRRAVRPVLENLERQKRFITDAGHELKTPISIIAANADVLSMTGQDNEWVRSIRGQTDRMEHLVQDLLSLARSEETASVADWLEFDLSDAVLDTAMPFSALAESRGKSVSLAIAPGIRFCGDEGALRRLVSILMDNALKYSTEGGEVSLSLRRENKRIILQQSNPCDDSAFRENPERLFDRFFRGDSSRSRESGGYGIGLSIAKGIVESHKGKISVTAGENQIRFTVVF